MKVFCDNFWYLELFGCFSVGSVNFMDEYKVWEKLTGHLDVSWASYLYPSNIFTNKLPVSNAYHRANWINSDLSIFMATNFRGWFFVCLCKDWNQFLRAKFRCWLLIPFSYTPFNFYPLLEKIKLCEKIHFYWAWIQIYFGGNMIKIFFHCSIHRQHCLLCVNIVDTSWFSVYVFWRVFTLTEK